MVTSWVLPGLLFRPIPIQLVLFIRPMWTLSCHALPCVAASSSWGLHDSVMTQWQGRFSLCI